MIEKGQKINDRYEVIKSIGEGGMANVYLAYDTILDRRVAVKVLRGDLSNDEKFVRRFHRSGEREMPPVLLRKALFTDVIRCVSFSEVTAPSIRYFSARETARALSFRSLQWRAKRGFR